MAVVQAAVFRSPAARFILLLGIVSLGADMTYEGARSIAGPFLAVLGMQRGFWLYLAAVACIAAGFADFLPATSVSAAP